MNILYFICNYESPMSRWHYFHEIDELQRYGIDILIVDASKYESLDQANECVVKTAGKSHFDLFMTAYSEKELYISTLDALHGMGIPTLLICFDNLVAPFEHKKVCKYYDLVWLTSIETESYFKKWGANTIFLPYAANPFVFQPQGNVSERKIAFVGSPYGSRANAFNNFIKNDIRVDIYGATANKSFGSDEKESKISKIEMLRSSLQYIRYPINRKLMLAALKQHFNEESILDRNSDLISFKNAVEGLELSKVYSSYGLSFSSTTARNTGVLRNPVSIVNLRAFEIGMSGGVQICRYSHELGNYYEAEKEIIFYKDEDEMIDLARFYLKPENQGLRDNIAKMARIRSEKEHTWMRRFEKVFEKIGISEDLYQPL